VAESHHLSQAWQAGDTVRAHAVAIRLCDEASGECGARRREAKREEDALDAVMEFVESDANHPSLERKGSGSREWRIGGYGCNR